MASIGRKEDIEAAERARIEQQIEDIEISDIALNGLHSNVKNWDTEEVLLWLNNILRGADALPEYEKSFRSTALKGVSLLRLDDRLLEVLGVTNAVHASLMQTYAAQLRKLQLLEDRKTTDDAKNRKTDAPYLKLQDEHAALLKRLVPYELGDQMSKWEPLDLFFFLSKPEHADAFAPFIKPIALKRIKGKELLDLLDNQQDPDAEMTEAEFNALKDAIPTIECDRREAQRFRRTVLNTNRRMRETRILMKRAEYQAKRKNLSQISIKEFTIGIVMDSGTFGDVRLGEYRTKKVVIKSPKIPTNEKADALKGGGKSFAVDEEEHTDANYKRCADIEYEAMMLSQAFGTGVLKVIGYDVTSREPCLVTEFMINMSVLKELQKLKTATGGESVISIFSKHHPRNKIDKDENGIDDPVLLQYVRIARDVAFALAGIHEKDILHNDISARNIFLDAAKRPKIGDFGCACLGVDMLEVFNFKKDLLEKNPAIQGEQFQVILSQAIKEKTKEDEDFERKCNMQMHSRALRWMPEWICANKRNPLLDTSIDIFSFGCFMLEMCTQQVPNPEIDDNDVERFKANGRGKPTAPHNIDSRYAAIMNCCWERELQLPMKTLAEKLSELHRELLKGGLHDSANHTALKEIGEKSHSASRGGTTYSNMSAAAGPTVYSSMNGTGSSRTGGAAPTGATLSYPKVARGRIRFSGTYDLSDVPEIAEMQQCGMQSTHLEKALDDTYRMRDHETILRTMMCICIDNDDGQVGMICLCLKRLSQLALDIHGCADEENTWKELCRSVLITLASAKEILNDSYMAEVVAHGLDTVASLLKHKTSDEVIPTFGFDICDWATEALSRFENNAEVVQNAANLIANLAWFSNAVQDRLHTSKAIYSLVHAMARYPNNYEVVRMCVTGISHCPLALLVDPSANDAVEEEKYRSRSPGRTLTALEIATQWSLVYMALYDACVSSFDKYVSLSVTDPKTAQEPLALLETIIQTMFRACDNVNNTLTKIKFLYGTTSNMIQKLYAILRKLPEHFRIQEGIIGMLAHMTETGYKVSIPFVEPVAGVSFDADRDCVPLQATSAQRIRAILDVDPTLVSLLSAMSKFSTDDTISTGIKSAALAQYTGSGVSIQGTGSLGHDVLYSAASTGGGLYCSPANSPSYVSSTGPATAGYSTGRAAYSRYSNAYRSTAGGGDSLKEDMSFDDLGVLDLQFDDNLQQITAASLQRSVAVILGVSCALVPEVQMNLLKTPFNELIVVAFHNFRRDIPLLRFGCHALLQICRKNARQQKMLHQLNIFKVLCALLELHNTMWMVMDGLVCAIIGLLEPDPDVHEMTDVIKILDDEEKLNKIATVQKTVIGLPTSADLDRKQKISYLVQERRKRFDGYTIATQLITQADVKFESKVTRMSLLQRIALLVGEFQMDPTCSPLSSNFLTLVQCVLFWLPPQYKVWESVFVDLTISPGIRKEFQNRKDMEITSWSRFFKVLNPTDPESKTVPAGKVLAIAPNDAQRFDDALDRMVEKFNWNSFQNCNLLEFTLISLRWNPLQPHVLTAGLTLYLAILRTFIDGNLSIGKELPYNAGGRNSDALLFFRQSAVQEGKCGMVEYCLFAKRKREDNPILVRYSLWILIIFLSQTSEDDGATVSQRLVKLGSALSGKNSTSMAIAADIATAGLIEWTIEVLIRYENFYSLQCLGTILLSWMEIHGRFSNRSGLQLKPLQEILVRNMTRKRDFFLPLSAEGPDAYLMGESSDIFGSLALHSRSLKRVVDKHLRLDDDHEPVVYAWDGLCRPWSVSVNHHDRATDDDGKPIDVFTLQVYWDQNMEWRLSYKFSMYSELNETLKSEFAHLPTDAVEFPESRTKLGKMLSFNNQAFLDQRKIGLDTWLKGVMQRRCVVNCRVLYGFLHVEEHLVGKPVNAMKRLPALIPVDAAVTGPTLLPVQSICSDLICSIAVVGRGLPKTSLIPMIDSKGVVRGSVSVYSSKILVGNDGDAKVPICPVVYFNVGVMAVAWERTRRIVVVGLSTGCIILFYLSPACDALVYCCEIDKHTGLLCNLIVDSRLGYLAGACSTGAISLFEFSSGDIHSSVSKAVKSGFNSFAFGSRDGILFGGTTDGFVVLFDLQSQNVKEHMISFQLSNTVVDNSRSAVCVAYVEEMRLLYCTHLHVISIYKVLPKESLSAKTFWTPWLVINMKEFVAKICTLTVFNRGLYVCVGTTKGAVTVYDISTAPTRETVAQALQAASTALGASRSRGVAGGVTVSASASRQTNYLSTAQSALVCWQEIIHANNTAIRDWLLANKIDAYLTSSRTDLIFLVAEVSNQSLSAIADELVPKKPRSDPLLSWNVATEESVAVGDAVASVASPSSKRMSMSVFEAPPMLTSSAFIEEEGVLAFGCHNGLTHFYSVADFLVPFTREDRDDISFIRSCLFADDYSKQMVRGPTKSKRGLQHIIVKNQNNRDDGDCGGEDDEAILGNSPHTPPAADFSPPMSEKHIIPSTSYEADGINHSPPPKPPKRPSVVASPTGGATTMMSSPSSNDRPKSSSHAASVQLADAPVVVPATVVVEPPSFDKAWELLLDDRFIVKGKTRKDVEDLLEDLGVFEAGDLSEVTPSLLVQFEPLLRVVQFNKLKGFLKMV